MKKEEVPHWDAIKRVASHANIEPSLIAAIVMTESSGQPYATRYEAQWKYLADVDSHANRLKITVMTETMHQATSWGLMQIMGGTARDLGFRDHMPRLCEVDTGLLWGCLYIARLKNRFPALPDMIAAYNAGTPRKDNGGKYFNQAYVDKVMSYVAEFKA